MNNFILAPIKGFLTVAGMIGVFAAIGVVVFWSAEKLAILPAPFFG